MLVPMEYGTLRTRGDLHIASTSARDVCRARTLPKSTSSLFHPSQNPPAAHSARPGPASNAASDSFAAREHDQLAAARRSARRAARRALHRTRPSRRSRPRAPGRGAFVVSIAPRVGVAVSTPRRRFRRCACRLVTKSAAVNAFRDAERAALGERAYLSHVHAERGQRAECLTRLLERLARVVNVGESPIEIQLQVTLRHRQRRPDFVGQRIQDLSQVRRHHAA